MCETSPDQLCPKQRVGPCSHAWRTASLCNQRRWWPSARGQTHHLCSEAGSSFFPPLSFRSSGFSALLRWSFPPSWSLEVNVTKKPKQISTTLLSITRVLSWRRSTRQLTKPSEASRKSTHPPPAFAGQQGGTQSLTPNCHFLQLVPFVKTFAMSFVFGLNHIFVSGLNFM